MQWRRGSERRWNLPVFWWNWKKHRSVATEGRKMENNANEAHIFWKSPDQQTEVWMKQVSGKTPEEKKEQSRS